jgi:putative transposase
VKYGFIREHAGHWPLAHLCRLLGVARSGYYDWRDQPGRVIPAQELASRRRMKELFRASRDSLGSRTLMKHLREEGFAIGRERMRRLMKALNLKVRHKRKYKVTTDSKHNLPVAENVLNRRFDPQGPNQPGSRT